MRTVVLIVLAVMPVLQVQAIARAQEPPASSPAQTTSTLNEEYWEAIYLKGAKVGYSHTVVRPVEEEGRLLSRIEHTDLLSLSRFGQTHESRILLVSFETTLGELVRFECRAELGSTPLESRGRVAGSELIVETTTAGKQTAARQPWPAGGGGFRAVARSLADQPLEVGDSRQVQEMMPLVNRLVPVHLAAVRYEPTRLPGGEYRLLRVEARAQLDPQQSIETILWADHRGRIIKSRLDSLDQESVRTTSDIALAPSTAADFDLGLDTTIKLSSALPGGHSSSQARYRIQLRDGDPTKVFLVTDAQQVRSLGDHAAEVIVTARHPARPQSQGPPALAPGEDACAAPSVDDRRANHFIQCDDPRIVAMAKEAAGERTDAWEVAVACEQYVHRAITRQNYSQAFATAAEVAETRQGDCTEHAVLLAALARACGLPARVAIGLVYIESEQGFGYHMWDEVWIDDHWYALDATLARAGIGAGHLQLGYSSLAGDSAFLSVLPVAQVLGRLSIEVVEAH
ncbi:MAG: lasso peptide biosynthesis protein [Pirellulales bacterium]|nr:lasso peptide biosynthesis protein [Pirellulales bacterium]